MSRDHVLEILQTRISTLESVLSELKDQNRYLEVKIYFPLFDSSCVCLCFSKCSSYGVDLLQTLFQLLTRHAQLDESPFPFPSSSLSPVFLSFDVCSFRSKLNSTKII